MTDSFAEMKRELYELMQRSRRGNFAPPLPEGVTPSEARTIMMVAGLRCEGEDVRPGRVAEMTHTTPSALSQTFKTLEEKGLIERRRASGDYRAVTVSLTEEGSASPRRVGACATSIWMRPWRTWASRRCSTSSASCAR